MVFNSLAFLYFAAVFFPIYFGTKGKIRLLWCLAASYFFYAYWDVKFLSLIILSTLIDYTIGLQIEGTNSPTKRKRLLILSLMANLGILVYFKYSNFFIESFIQVLHSVGFGANEFSLSVILPVGISFFTFQSMSYTIDVYKGDIAVEKSFLKFATYISFFPQLVAGPIVRARDFLKQLDIDHQFEWTRFLSGFGLFIIGFFKKVAVADTIAPFVDQCFLAPTFFSSSHLLVGIIFFAFQIYADFSGYSDMAIGLARIMGFEFPVNFRTPYFSKNFSEFWNRWHISLSSWLRDYLYIPLGGNRKGSKGSIFFIWMFGIWAIIFAQSLWVTLMIVVGIAFTHWAIQKIPKHEILIFTSLNLLVTMLLGGLWHGAGMQFIFWGFLHGMFQVVQKIIQKPYKNLGLPKYISNSFSILLVFTLTCWAWIYFRAENFTVANQYITQLISFTQFNISSIINKFLFIKGIIAIGTLLILDLFSFNKQIEIILAQKPKTALILYVILLWFTAAFGTFGSNSFIYFQF